VCCKLIYKCGCLPTGVEKPVSKGGWKELVAKGVC
jgi:hypothetical protein